MTTTTTATTNDLYRAVCVHIAPQLASERLDCLLDPDWNGSKSWLSTRGIGEELGEDFIDAWDDLTYGEQRQMLADALEAFDDAQRP